MSRDANCRLPRVPTSIAGGSRRGPALVAVACLIMLAGCRTLSQPDVQPLDRPAPALVSPQSPGERLDMLASAERTQDAAPRDRPAPPPPPGIDPRALARNADADAELDLATALARIAAASTLSLPRTPVVEDEADGPPPAEAVARYVKGRRAAYDGKLLIATTELGKALELDPSSVAIRRELARTYLQRNGTPTAVALYVQILEREPDDVEALLNLALIRYERRDFDQAAAILARAWELPAGDDGRRFVHDPGGDIVANHMLSAVLRQKGYDRAAIEAAMHAVEVPPSGLGMYPRRLASIYRQRSDIWREIGDGLCRLGDYDGALDAYEQAASLPTTDPRGVTTRIVYANLLLGRPHRAQLAVLDDLRRDPSRIGDDEIGLCRYLADEASPVDELADAVLELYEANRDVPQLVRAAAALLPRDRSIALLREYVERHPRDVAVVTPLLRWLGESDPEAAAAVAVGLVRQQPDLAEDHVQRLVVSGPIPSRMLEAARTLAASPARATFEARMLMQLEALGRAWTVVQRALERWPADEGLLLLQLDLAGMLGERDLIERAMQAASDLDSRWAWITRSRVLGGLGDAEAAVEAAQRAARVDGDEGRGEALLAVARAKYLRAASTLDEARQERYATDTADAARAVLELMPESDGAFEILINLYNTGGILEETGALGRVAEGLRSSNPESRLYAMLVVRDLIGQRRYEPALDRLLSLYEADPTDGVSLSLAIAVWSQLGRQDDAVKWLNEQRAERRGDPLLLEQWTRLKLEGGGAPEAITVVAKRADVDPENDIVKRLLESCLMAMDDREEAVRIGEARLLARPRGVARELGLAAMYGRAGMGDRALEHLEWIVREAEVADEDDLLSALQIARELDDDEVSQRRSLDDLIMAAALRLIESVPRSPMFVYGAALEVLARRGQVDDRRFDELVRRAVEASPGGSDQGVTGAMLWQRLAQRLVDAGFPSAAARALRGRLFAVAPLDVPARSRLAVMTIAADAATGGQVDKTMAMLFDLDARGMVPPAAPMDEAAAMPALANMLYEASQVYSIVGDEDGAGTLLREVLVRAGNHAMALNNLGYLRLVSPDANDEREAIEGWIELAYALQPDDANILDTIGWLRYKQGRITTPPDATADPGAVDLIEEAVRRSDDPSGELYDHLGDALYRAGRVEEAVDAWKKAVDRIDRPRWRTETLEQYRLIQTSLWNLRVADPEALFERDFGRILERARAKIAAVERGDEPAVAAQFE